MRRLKLLAFAGVLFAVTTVSRGQSTGVEQGGVRFEISVPSAVHAEAITGRVYVMVTRRPQPEPFLQIGRTGIPFFGRDIVELPPGATATIDSTDLGTPVASLRNLPPGDYYVQSFVNIYSEFRRADGHVVWMHDDRWEGQHWNRSPGNLYSDVRRISLDPLQDRTITLEATNVIDPIDIPPDTEWVRRFRFESPSLTEFWGRPIYLGATVLLPRGYDDETRTYPVIYEQGHFSLDAPMYFAPGTRLHREWTDSDFPQMLVVTFQDPNPYFDTSYSVNSINVGPYGDAIMEELIPEIERRFRVIGEPWARVLTGGSTGGWEALALQIFHPDFFGGTWSYCPDPVDFHDVEQIDLYSDTNAFYRDVGGRRVPTPNTREIDGSIRLTSEQRNHFELVNGTRGRSGEQLDIWSAVYGPLGDDGYFKPLFDKFTGDMDPEVADFWIDNYSLLYYLQRNWGELGPRLVGKLHVFTGTMDNFYLNNSTRVLDEWMQTTTNPHYEGYFEYGEGAGHCYVGRVPDWDRLREIADYMMDRKPENAPDAWY